MLDARCSLLDARCGVSCPECSQKTKETNLTFDYDRLEGWPHAMDIEAGVNRHCLAKMLEFFDEHLGASE